MEFDKIVTRILNEMDERHPGFDPAALKAHNAPNADYAARASRDYKSDFSRPGWSEEKNVGEHEGRGYSKPDPENEKWQVYRVKNGEETPVTFKDKNGDKVLLSYKGYSRALEKIKNYKKIPGVTYILKTKWGNKTYDEFMGS